MFKTVCLNSSVRVKQVFCSTIGGHRLYLQHNLPSEASGHKVQRHSFFSFTTDAAKSKHFSAKRWNALTSDYEPLLPVFFSGCSFLLGLKAYPTKSIALSSDHEIRRSKIHADTGWERAQSKNFVHQNARSVDHQHSRQHEHTQNFFM